MILHKEWEYGKYKIKLFEDETVTDYGGTDKGHFYWTNLYYEDGNFISSIDRFTSVEEGIEYTDNLIKRKI